MTFVATLDPVEVAVNRQEVDINDGPGISISQDGIDWGDAAVQAYMADAQVGSDQVDRRIPNRIVTIPFGLGMGEAGEAAFYAVKAALTQKVALFQSEGGTVKRGGDLPMYADVVNATLTIPDHWGETAFLEDACKLVLECKPDFYGDEIQLDTIHATNSRFASVLTAAGQPATILGDYPGRLRLTVTEQALTYHSGITWGVRSRFYDPANTAKLLMNGTELDAGADAARVALAGTITGQAIESNALDTTRWFDICSLSLAGVNLTHVGTYRVWARVWCSTTPNMRLIWDLGDLYSPVKNTLDQIVDGGHWNLVDLGMVNIRRSVLAPQVWLGSIQGKSAVGTSGDRVFLDQVILQPLDEFSGRAKGADDNLANAACLPLKTAELRWDGCVRAAAVGYKPIPTTLGDLPRIPPSLNENRVAELMMKVNQGNVHVPPYLDSDDGLNNFQVDVRYRPCYLSRP